MASNSVVGDDNTSGGISSSPEITPSYDRSQAKRRRLLVEQEQDEGSRASRTQAFRSNIFSGNTRAHLGNQYVQGDLVQHFHDGGSGQDDKRPASAAEIMASLSFEQMGSRHLTIGRAQAKTCQWLLARKEYKSWRDVDKLPDHHGFLWLKGKPAAGKSTAMKFLYDNALRQARGDIVISYFFNARGDSLETSVEGMYRSLLYQLLEKIPKLNSVFEKSMHGKTRHAWTVDILKDLLFDAVLHLGPIPLVCYVDALDECNEDDVRDMVYFLQRLAQTALSQDQHVFVCFSSRHYPHITIRKGQQLVLEGQEEHENDIAEYIRANLYVDEPEIAEEIQNRASGVFLWAVLVVKILNKLYDHGRVSLLHARLREIPDGLNSLFEDILKRGASDDTYLTITIQWILYAERPLRPVELYHAVLSAALASSEVCKDDDMARFILSSSKGLAEVTTGIDSVVQFIHESVRDYLVYGGGMALLEPGLSKNIPGHCNDLLKSCCVRYIIFTEDEVTQCLPADNLSYYQVKRRCKRLVEQRPFLQYALRGIIYHGDSALGYGIPQEAFIRDFPLKILVNAWNTLEEHPVRHYSNFVDAAYIFVNNDATNLLEEELRQNMKPLAGSERYGTALDAAVMKRNMHAVKVLLQYSPSPVSNNFDDLDSTLNLAVTQSTDAFKLILENRPHATLGDLGNVLLKVALTTSIEMSQILVQRGARLPENDSYDFPRLIAYLQKRPDALDVIIDAFGTDHCSRLLHKVAEKDLTIANKMLQKGVEIKHRWLGPALVSAGADSEELIDAFGVDGYDQLLYSAAEAKNKMLVDRMLRRRVHVKCNHELARVLLSAGPDPDVLIDTFGANDSLLYEAARAGKGFIVSRMLRLGASVNTGHDTDGSVLQVAIAHDHGEIAHQLLSAGADVNLTGGRFSYALGAAAVRGNLPIFKELIARGANVNLTGGYRGHETALQRAVVSDNPFAREEMVSILLERGADVNIPENACRIRLKDADGYTLTDSHRRSALHKAKRMGNQNIINMLVEKGAIAGCGQQECSQNAFWNGIKINAGQTYGKEMVAANNNALFENSKTLPERVDSSEVGGEKLMIDEIFRRSPRPNVPEMYPPNREWIRVETLPYIIEDEPLISELDGSGLQETGPPNTLSSRKSLDSESHDRGRDA